MISVDLKSFSAIRHTRRRVNTNELILSNAIIGGPSKKTIICIETAKFNGSGMKMSNYCKANK